MVIKNEKKKQLKLLQYYTLILAVFKKIWSFCQQYIKN